MIAKRVNKTAAIGEDFTRLGEYIAAAREVGESWTSFGSETVLQVTAKKI